jgi:hypothetical protein
MSESESSRTDDSQRNVIGIVRGSGAVQWLFIDGSRFQVAGVFLAGGFVILLGAILFFGVDLDGSRMVWLFGGLIDAIVSLTTIVLTINQLILSRQFGSPTDLYDRLEDRIDFRDHVEDQIGASIVPSQPGGFIRVLFRTLRGRAIELGRLDTDHDERLRAVLDKYVETITEQARETEEKLENQPFEMAGLLTLLDYDDSWQFYTTRRLQTIYGDSLTNPEIQLVDDVRDLLKYLDTARQYFKTLYLQRELSQLSRAIIYTGSLSILTMVLVLMIYRNKWMVSVEYVFLAVILSVATVITLSPIAVLFSYILRIATVTRRTVVFGPFTPKEEQEIDSDWNL